MNSLERLLTAVVISGLISFGVCMLYKGLEQGWLMFIFFALFWALGVFGVLTGADLIYTLRNPDEDDIENAPAGEQRHV